MRALLLIPSVLKPSVEAEGTGSHTHEVGPLMDYYALAAQIRRGEGDGADILDYAAVDNEEDAVVKFVRRLAGRDAALALMGFRVRERYDVVFTNGENVGIPLALLFKTVKRRPGHVTIGHRLSTGKKRLFFSLLRAHRQIDRILVYATTQLDFARQSLRLPADKLRLIAFHADQRFFHPLREVPVDENQICSAGLEWRDYPTLIDAVQDIPNLKVKLAAASPWSKHTNETEGRTLPDNVEACRYDYAALRTLYAQSSFVVVPLYENDFQAGITTILEAMAMGKAVIASSTTGQTDAIEDGVNGLMVPPGDVARLRHAIDRLRTNADLRDTLAANARKWLEQHASLDLWVDNVVAALRETLPAWHSQPVRQTARHKQ
jgi:glycosyltransferase involved in cell wall biosynthesis